MAQGYAFGIISQDCRSHGCRGQIQNAPPCLYVARVAQVASFPLRDMFQGLLADMCALYRVKQGDYGFLMKINEAFINKMLCGTCLAPLF
ncbi:MAG: hypothetical protein A2Z01_04070 [Betaproteobacteria bacterium RBG_16_58_11]|nr:MAG: hypothetical protein A2Z01_04070 [Betaproteobacteria bacterium RBG_16_58_11]